MKNYLYQLLYRVLVKLVDHDYSDISEEYINSWLISSYLDPGFKNYLTSKYANYTKYLAGSYRGDVEYKKVITKLITLRQLELDSKTAYLSSPKNEKKKV